MPTDLNVTKRSRARVEKMRHKSATRIQAALRGRLSRRRSAALRKASKKRRPSHQSKTVLR